MFSRYTSTFNRADSQLGDSQGQPGKVQDYETIKQECLARGALYEDRLFSPRSTRQGDYVWLRPYEITESPKFFSEGVSRFDVVQGELGDCWLVAAVANLTLNPKLFSVVVPTDQSFERGSYCGLFRFRFWQFGKWVEVVIDDRLPTKNGKLVFMHSSDQDEFWSSLLEKAYSKLNGSYDALRGGTTCEAMVDMTGGLTEFFDVQTEETPPNLFQIIHKGHMRGSLIGCSIEAKDESEREDALPNGLIKGHAYSVTSVKSINIRGNTVNMLRMRNPWHGTSEWNGPWSDKSREWSMVSESDRRDMGLVFDADGEFWMCFEDFKCNFTRVELCNLSPDDLNEHMPRAWYSQMFEGAWVRGKTAGGCRNNIDTFCQNPQYIVNLVDPDEDDDQDLCTMIVALMQKNRRAAKKHRMGSSDLTIGFAVYALKGGVYQSINPVGKSDKSQQIQLLNTEFFRYNASVARSPTYINLREVTARFMLPPGSYVIIPSTFDKNEEGEFMLRVWTEAPAGSGLDPGVTPSAHHIMPGPTPGPTPGPMPSPTPRPPRLPVEPSYPPEDGDAGEDEPRKPTPAYPPYPKQPDQPDPNAPSYPPYPSGGGDGDGDGGRGGRMYPPLPDEPSIIPKRAPSPPPGPSIDITLGEVAGFIAGLISLISFCYNNYQRFTSSSAQTYPYPAGGGPRDAPFGQRMSTLQMKEHEESSKRTHNQQSYSSPTSGRKQLEKSPADFVGVRKSRTPSPQ